MEPDELEQDFVARLNETFGSTLFEGMEKPAEYRVGERMLYRMEGNRPAERKSYDATATEAALREITAKTGGTLTIEPPVESGLPHPRVVDIPEALLMYDNRMTAYLASDDALPDPDFRLEWLIGTVQTQDEDLFLYVDFRHPTLKAVFSDIYRARHDWDRSAQRTREGYQAFLKRCADLRRELDTGERRCSCLKVIAGEDVPLQDRSI